MTWEEQVEYFESLIRLEKDPELIEYYANIIDIWIEIGQLAQLHDFTINNLLPN